MRPLFDFVRRDPGADVLVATNMWPEPERPVYGVHVERQVDSLRKAGLNCDVLYVRGYRSKAAYLLAALRFASSSVAWRGRYRVVHVYAGETALAARFHVGTPMLVSYCGDDILGDRRADGSTPLSARLRSAVLRTHSRFFAATITKSRAMEAALPVSSRRRNSVIPNGVDRRLFYPIARTDARRRLGWNPDEHVVLFAATKPESPAKRLSLAQHACELAARRIQPLRLHVAGAVEPATMPWLMSAADCLLMTSAVEGSPNTVKEALMCNLPVVATPAGDVVERLEGVDPSWICPPEPPALADALVDCLAAPRRSNGRSVARDLSEQAVATKIMSLYASLVVPPTQPSTPAPSAAAEKHSPYAAEMPLVRKARR